MEILIPSGQTNTGLVICLEGNHLSVRCVCFGMLVHDEDSSWTCTTCGSKYLLPNQVWCSAMYLGASSPAVNKLVANWIGADPDEVQVHVDKD